MPTVVSNISHKRNQGFKTAQDVDYYALIDSDAYPHRDWLNEAIKCFVSLPDVWCVTGPNISPGYSLAKQQAVSNALMSFLVNGPRAFMRHASADSRFVDACYSCNMIIAREAIEATRGFDETLETGEDTDFCWRIQDREKRIFFSNMVTVYHHNRMLYLPFIRQRLIAGHSASALFVRKPGLASLMFFLPLAFFLFLALGWLLGAIHSGGTWLWLGGVTCYLLAALVEAGRWSRQLSELPLTWVAILIGGLTPAFGTIAGGLGMRFQPRTFAANFPASVPD